MAHEPDFSAIPDRADTGSLKWEHAYIDDELISRSMGAEALAADQVLPMWVADMDFRSPQPVIDALVARAEHGIYGYTIPPDSYYEAITSWMKRRHGWSVEADWILTTPGVNQAVSYVVHTFTEPGDGVILQLPLYGPMRYAVSGNERQVVNNPLVLTDGRYEIGFDDLEAKAADPNTKMIILCSPHNPVGRVFGQAELQRMGEIAAANDLLILCDEVHGDLTYPWAEFRSIGSLGEQFYERLMVANAPSKTFNVPGLQTANLIVPSPDLRTRLEETMAGLGAWRTQRVFGLTALETAYNHGEPWLAELITYLEGNLRFIDAFVSEHLPELELIKPEALYLAWIDCRATGLGSDDLFKLLYEDAKVYVESGTHFGEGGDGFIRINYATSRDVVSEALNRIAAVIG